MKRITVNMVKKSIKGTLKEEEMDKAFNDLAGGVIDDDDGTKAAEKTGYALGLMFGSLYKNEIPEEARIEMIKRSFDKIAEIFMTPKAWDLMKSMLIEDINKNVK